MKKQTDVLPIALRLAGLGAVALLVSGCDPPKPTVENKVNNDFKNTPVDCTAQPCPDVIIVDVLVMDEEINEPLRNVAVKVTFGDGRVVRVVTDQRGIAAVSTRPGERFDIEVEDLHKMADTHTPR